ncbi:MAG: DUF4136 domain-containing protein, partial [Alphaproteobacteria bacterium]|nr:DUF4136 domain-containing protein [Alphaproteobacteria bacterium]
GCGGGLGYGYGFGGFGYGPWSPFYGGYAFGFDPYMWGPETDIQSQIIYTSGFDMEIDRASDHQRVFEGHAKAVSSVDNLTYLVPNLIDAMFTNFPGKSGETVKITIAPPKKH